MPVFNFKQGGGKRKLKPIALGTAAALAFTTGGIATFANAAAPDASDASSAAYANLISLDGLNIDIADLVEAQSLDGSEAQKNSLNASLLDSSLNLNLGELALPLIKTADNNGLLDLGDAAQAGLLSAYAASPSETQAIAAAGAVGEDGAIALETDNADNYGSAKINATPLLEQVIGAEATQTLLNEASVSIGALASRYEKNGTEATSQYAVADLGLDVKSDTVGAIVTELDGTVDEIVQPISDLIADEGAVETLVSGLVTTLNEIPLVSAELNELSLTGVDTLTQEITDELLAQPIENTEGTVSIDLNTGNIHVDLAGILMAEEGVENLNSLPANTEVIDADTLNAVSAGVLDALTGTGENSVTTKITNLLTEGIYNLGLNVDVQVEVSASDTVPIVGDVLPPLVDAPVTINGTLGGFLGQDGHEDPAVDVSQISVAGIDVGAVVTPVTEALTGLVSSIGSALQTTVVDTVITNITPTVKGVLDPIVTNLVGGDGALRDLLGNLLRITINAQPEQGDLGEGSKTVRALSVTLLPALGENAVALNLASSTVKSLDEATVEPTPEPTTEPTVEPTTEPTVEPTTEPTVEPTTEPTVEPTTEPTVEPTTEPTVEPTTEPTVEPTATATPKESDDNSLPVTGTSGLALGGLLAMGLSLIAGGAYMVARARRS